MEIRRAKLSDAPGLARLSILFWESHKGVSPLLELKKKATLESETKEARRVVRKGKPEIYVAIKSGSIIGSIEISTNKKGPLFKVRKSGYIEALVVDKKSRRSGVALALLTHVKTLFKKRGIRYVTVTVYPPNKLAVKFWKKAGFKGISENVIATI